MDPGVLAALIAAGIAVVLALLSAYLAVRQRAADLVVAALSHMGGGSQDRSAGIAALKALRGPLYGRSGLFDRLRGWNAYGPAIGQQLFRQLIYLLNYGKGRYWAHEVENIIAMTDWLLRDSEQLGFTDEGQRTRLRDAIRRYVAGAEPSAMASMRGEEAPPPELGGPTSPSLDELRRCADQWMERLPAAT